MVIVLDAGIDGVLQLAEALAGESDIDAIHLFSHGSPGSLYLGSAVLNSASLSSYTAALAQIGNALTDTGDLLLYGCDVAQGDQGQAFIRQIAASTGADVAASDDPTGATLLGGDADLEIQIGDISTTELVSQLEFNNFDRLLAFPPDTITPGIGTLIETPFNSGLGDFTISVTGEIDYYRFIASGTGQHQVVVAGGFGIFSLDGQFRVYDGNGFAITNIIDEGDDGQENISLNLTAGNWYYIAVSAGNAIVDLPGWNTTNGEYALIVSGPPPIADSNDQISEAFSIGAISGITFWQDTIDITTDVDMFSFSVNAGQSVAFDIDLWSGPLDSILRLFDSNGEELASNDDGLAPNEVGPTLDSYMQYTLDSSGTYYLGVSSYPNDSYNAVTGNSDIAGSTGGYRLYVSAISLVAPTITAVDIFQAEGGGVEDAGRIRVMADLSKAAYALQAWENPFINDFSEYADGAYLKVLNEEWVPLNLGPFSSVNNTSVVAGQTVTNTVTMSNGFYTNGNAAAFVARSADSVVIAFRGTNDNGDENPSDDGNMIVPDKEHWNEMRSHYALLLPLIDALDDYVDSGSNGIGKVYVTGHSLGGAMAIQYMGTHGGDMYSAVTFAAPGFVDFVDPAGGAYYPDTNRVLHIEINGDLTPDLGVQGGRTAHFQGDDDAWYSPGANHSMDYYRQITQSVDPTAWTAILAQSGDPEVFLGARISGSNFIVDGLISGANLPVDAGEDILTDPPLNNYDVYYGGRGSDVLIGGGGDELLLGGADNDTLYGNGGNDTLDGGFGFDLLDGGAGIDTADYQFYNGAIDANLTTGVVGFPGNSLLTDSIVNIENLLAGGGADHLTGNGLNNYLGGGAGNDNVNGGAGNDTLDGGAGIDTASYISAFRQSVLSGTPLNTATFTGPEGSDTLMSIESLQFIDGILSYDAGAHIWQIERLYGSAFDRTADVLGLNYHSGRLDAGTMLATVAEDFAASAEFLATYGSLNNSAFVSQLYQNVLERAADAGGLAYWTAQLDSAAMTRGEVLAGFSDAAENIGNYAAQLANGLWDIDEQAASVARLYHGTFDRAPDAGGLGYWTSQLKTGAQTLQQEAAFFVASAEFQNTYGSLNNSQFVDQLYVNVLDRHGEPGGLAYWTGLLDTGTQRADVTLGFTESAEFQVNIIGQIDNGIVVV